jgi:hypothetical protein
MHFSTITFTALVAALAGQQAQAAPATMSDINVRAMYEALGNPSFGERSDPSSHLLISASSITWA